MSPRSHSMPRMFKLLFPFSVTIIPGICHKHAGCVEYSVIPDDPTQHRYELHSMDPNLDTGVVTMQILQAFLSGMENHE
jgi:hypothetical protein